jgi:hypothetical protein
MRRLKMAGEKISDQIYGKVSKKIQLSPLPEFDDLKTIVTPDGRKVGSFRAYTGEKIEKFSIAEFSLMPGMDYTNASIKPRSNYNIPRYSFNCMVMTEQKKIQFDVDLYPAVDLAIRQDYIDRYYELLTDLYLKEKKASYFDWKVSDRSHNLIHAYLNVALKICEEEREVSAEEAKKIADRTDYLTKILLEREPERHLLEKAFGQELTERLGKAMV